MEYVSAKLTKSQVLEYLTRLPSLLAALGYRECDVSYGWLCDLPVDALWCDHRISVDALSTFIGSAVDQEIFNPGGSELFIESTDSSVSVKFCHESDVHVTAEEGVAIALMDALPTRIRHKARLIG